MKREGNKMKENQVKKALEEGMSTVDAFRKYKVM